MGCVWVRAAGDPRAARIAMGVARSAYAGGEGVHGRAAAVSRGDLGGEDDDERRALADLREAAREPGDRGGGAEHHGRQAILEAGGGGGAAGEDFIYQRLRPGGIGDADQRLEEDRVLPTN